jgi:rod shape-determining protein MreC
MRGLLRFIFRYHPVIVFIILEVVAFMLISHFNSFHRARILEVKHGIMGNIERRYEKFSSYFSLVKENKALMEENVKLYNKLPTVYINPMTTYIPDSLINKQYKFISARVINNSTNKQFNFITINKGRLDGIEPEMGVICDEGIVGVVKETTDNFASVISVLNREFFPSAKIKRNGYFGPLEWPGKRFDQIILKEIPVQVDVQTGDTIITSGYSSIFPEGIMVGTIKDFQTREGIYYDIRVNLSTDFKKLSNVYVVKNLFRQEKLKLELKTSHD